MNKNKNKKSTIFVFDANFFICLRSIHAKQPYPHLRFARKTLNVEFHVSAQVFNECPFIVGGTLKRFNSAIKIGMIKDEDLLGVKNDLKRMGVRLLAQDPDLSLVALAKSLKSEDNDVFIVSDDFKLNQNIKTLNYLIKCIPLPSFLQILGKNLVSREKNYWKFIRKRILKLNLDYMMQRSDIYAPQAKITWFIENAVSIAGEGIELKTQNLQPIDGKKVKVIVDEDKNLLDICNQFLKGRAISKRKLELIKDYQNILEIIKKERKKIQFAKEALMKNEYLKSLKQLRLINENYNNLFQLTGAKISKNKYRFFEKLMASEISKVVFLRAYILIENNKIISALSALDLTAFFATMADIPKTVLTINYLKGLLYVYHSKYDKAIEQFDFNYKLANSLKIDENLAQELKFKAIIGGTITNFLIGKQKESFDQIELMLKEMTPKILPNLMNALIDSGDYFLALGFPEIASNLYSESLECAIDSKKKWKFNFMLNKMKKAYMASSLLSTETRPSGDISVLIDKFHDLQDVNTFNDLIIQLAKFTNKFYEPFEYFSKGDKKITKYWDLPDKLKDEWECVKIEEDSKTGRTFLIGYKEEVGLVAFDVMLGRNLDGVPENYLIKLKRTAKIHIIQPDEINEALFLIRAVIKIDNEERDIEIIRKIPIFFKQMA